MASPARACSSEEGILLETKPKPLSKYLLRPTRFICFASHLGLLQTQNSIDSCNMTIDENTTVESLPLSLDSGDPAFAMGLENELQENDTVEKSGMTEQRKRTAPKGQGRGRKKRCQTNDVGKSSEAFQQPDSAMDLESQQQACDIVQGQANKRMKKLIPVRPRKQQVPNELPKAKGKGHQTFDVSRSPKASQPTVPTGTEKPVRVLINENKSPPEVLKVLMDRLIRRMKIDKSADMEKFIQLLNLVFRLDIKFLFAPIAKALGTISRQWPVRSDLDNILKDIAKERAMGKRSTFDEEMILRFEAVEQAIKTSDEKRAEDSAKVGELGEIFCVEGVSTETLREKLSTAFPFLFSEEKSTKELPKDNILQEISTTKVINQKTLREKIAAAFPNLCLTENVPWEIPGDVDEEMFAIECPTGFTWPWDEANATNEPRLSFEDLKNELLDVNNRDVKVSDFHGLQDAINSAKGRIPDHLKIIVEKIEQDRGEVTPPDDLHKLLLVLLSASVKEMEDLAVHELNRPMLLILERTPVREISPGRHENGDDFPI
ncbi:hypothetical protein V6N12_036312 [Hibiscus sabdariffa]|uniref:Uncharacterized protein n=1 Tax=Hibiscus sabdariffa TaxID=183260 RepID=A0ABR2EU97_9ROSI